MNAACPHKWWSTLKSAVFFSTSFLPPLTGMGGGLVCGWVGNSDILYDNFDSKQSRDSVELWSSCYPFSQSYQLCFQIELY